MTDDNDDGADGDPRAGRGGSGADGGRVLTPEELDISESEHVSELDEEGRYVVSAGGGSPDVPEEAAGRDDGPDRRQDRRDTGAQPRADARRDTHAPGRGPASPEAARQLLSEELGRTEARYGIDIVARFDGDPVRHRTVSNDVVATFENLVRWYAQHVTDDTPTDEVIEILFNEAGLTRPAETPNLAELLDSHDLEPEDSIADLVEAIRDEAADN